MQRIGQATLHNHDQCWPVRSSLSSNLRKIGRAYVGSRSWRLRLNCLRSIELAVSTIAAMPARPSIPVNTQSYVLAAYCSTQALIHIPTVSVCTWYLLQLSVFVKPELLSQFSALVNMLVLINRDISMPGLVRTWTGDRLQSWYVTRHSGQLSLAIPPCVDAMSTSKIQHINRNTARCTSSISIVLQADVRLRIKETEISTDLMANGRTLIVNYSFCFQLKRPKGWVMVAKL